MLFYYLCFCTNPAASLSSLLPAAIIVHSVSVRLLALEELLLGLKASAVNVERCVADYLLGILGCLNLPRVEATFTLTPAVISVLGHDFDIGKHHC